MRGSASFGTSTGIPVIDFSGFVGGGATPASRAKVADALFCAFRDVGFATLVHHSIPAPLITSAFASSAMFFALLEQAKQKYRWLTAAAIWAWARRSSRSAQRT